VVCYCLTFYLRGGRGSDRVLVGPWIYNYMCNQCRSPLKLLVQTPPGRGLLNRILRGKVCQWRTTGRWFYVFSRYYGFLRQ
jgi:hypothetical protein